MKEREALQRKKEAENKRKKDEDDVDTDEELEKSYQKPDEEGYLKINLMEALARQVNPFCTAVLCY